MLKTHVILIIHSEVLFEKVDYVECLLHGLLNHLTFGIIFSKNYFSKKFAVFPPVFNRFHRNFTGWTCDFNRPNRTGLPFLNRF
jgi:hypothetical protein